MQQVHIVFAHGTYLKEVVSVFGNQDQAEELANRLNNSPITKGMIEYSVQSYDVAQLYLSYGVAAAPELSERQMLDDERDDVI